MLERMKALHVYFQLYLTLTKCRYLQETSVPDSREERQTEGGRCSQLLHAKVGEPMAVREEYCNEWEGPSETSQDHRAHITIQQRLLHATVHICSKVTATFQLRPKIK